jgi:hypothetical protein
MYLYGEGRLTDACENFFRWINGSDDTDDADAKLPQLSSCERVKWHFKA